MPKNLYIRSLGVMTFLWGLVFVVGMVLVAIITVAMPGIIPVGSEYLIILIPVIFALLVIGFQYLISPWIMDFTMGWVYNATKYQVEDLPPHIKNFLLQQMELNNFSNL